VNNREEQTMIGICPSCGKPLWKVIEKWREEQMEKWKK
jgi:hypothetical protein